MAALQTRIFLTKRPKQQTERTEKLSTRGLLCTAATKNFLQPLLDRQDPVRRPPSEELGVGPISGIVGS